MIAKVYFIQAFGVLRILHARGWMGFILLMFLSLGLAADGLGAEIAVKGQDLEGSVVGFTAEGVSFETVYGKGAIVIPWADAERLQSEKEFVILYGEEELAIGRAWGLKEGKLLVGESPEKATEIPVEQIYRSLTREKYETSRLEAMRVRYRYWNANFDLAFSYTEATVETNAFAVGLEFERKKKPTELFLGGYYRYATTQTEGEERIKNEDRIFGRGRLDYTISERLFSFGALTAERDEIQEVRFRTDPNVGLGYRFVKRKNLIISGRVGPGYVYQKYFDGQTNDYFTILFGGDLDANLPYGSKLRIRVEYLPAVDDWTDNYLVRGGLDFTVPIIGWLDFKFTIFNIYNSQPPPGTQRNSFITTAGLSFRF
jgi:putative salt-induced outer membrane protein YdiY